MRTPALGLMFAVLAAAPAAAPVVSGMVAAAVPVPPGGTTAVTVTATDPSGGALGYTWSSTGGSITGSGPSIAWQAPGTPGTYSVSVQVSSDSGSSVAGVDIEVSAGLEGWHNPAPPADCPFPQSSLLGGTAFTGARTSYHFADTWYPSWGADGFLYSPWQDGSLLTAPYDGLSTAAWSEPSQNGWAKIGGDDPLNLQFVEAGVIQAPRQPYGGRYPCASLHHDGVWYYGSYVTTNVGGSNEPTVTTAEGDFNWGVLGPFVGFHVSTDGGHSWTQTPHTPSSPLFAEPASFGGKVKIGVPHVVDFGRNMEHSPDGKMYLVAHGAMDPDPQPRTANLSWINGDQIYLTRVTPSPATINDASAYEYFAGHDAGGNAVWASDFSQIKPLINWNNRCGNVSMTWVPALGRYLMFVTDGWPTTDTMDTYLLESASITGPFSLVSWWNDFGPQGYFFNIPSKFVSADGLSFWMFYSANFTWSSDAWVEDPPGSGYHLCIREVRLRRSVSGSVNGVALPPPVPTPGPVVPGGGSAAAALPGGRRDGANGDQGINDQCLGSVSPASLAPLAGLLLATCVFLRRRR